MVFLLEARGHFQGWATNTLQHEVAGLASAKQDFELTTAGPAHRFHGAKIRRLDFHRRQFGGASEPNPESSGSVVDQLQPPPSCVFNEVRLLRDSGHGIGESNAP